MNYLTISKLGIHDNFIYFKNIVKKNVFEQKGIFKKHLFK